MRYNKFLFKETLFVLLLYIVGVAGSCIIHNLWLGNTPIETFLYSITQTVSWLITSYIYFVDMNNNMISRLIINGGTRSGIWLSKGITVILASIMMIIIQFIAVFASNGISDVSAETLIDISVITILLTTFIGALTALLCVIIKNMSVVVILIFAYISPWTYVMVANFCEKSNLVIIKKNPFYLLLKMANTGVIDKTGIILCCITAVISWLVSFVIIQRTELKEEN